MASFNSYGRLNYAKLHVSKEFFIERPENQTSRNQTNVKPNNGHPKKDAVKECQRAISSIKFQAFLYIL